MLLRCNTRYRRTCHETHRHELTNSNSCKRAGVIQCDARCLPVGVETGGCLVEAQGCNQDGCPSGTGTTGLSYPGGIQLNFVNHCGNSAMAEEIRQQ